MAGTRSTYSLDFAPNLDGLANDFVTNADGHGGISPTPGDRMNVRATNTATFDLDVNVIVVELLGRDLLFLEVGPLLHVINDEAFEGFRIAHRSVSLR